MMAGLSEALKNDAKRRQVVDDGVAVIEAEVADKSGLSGMGIKATFKIVQGIAPGFIPRAFNHLLDDFAKQIDPFWAECQKGNTEPRAYFNQHGAAIANALLKITDERAKNAHGPAKSAYEKLRPEATKHVIAAMPRIADLLKKHAA